MKSYFNYRFLTLLIILMISFGLHGQQIPDSLAVYLETASKNNPTVLRAFYEYQAALQRIPQVGSLPDPELNAGIFMKPMELVAGNQVADLRLMQMFPWFGVLRSAKDEMSLMAKAKSELLRDARLQVYYEVQSTWYDLYKNRKKAEISRKNIEILQTIERLALVKFQSLSGTGGISPNPEPGNTGSIKTEVPAGPGMQEMSGSRTGSPAGISMQAAQDMAVGSRGSSGGMAGLADVYRIQIESLEVQELLAELKEEDITITARFNSYLNRSPATPVFTPDTIQTDTISLALIMDSDSIISNNPMLNMLEFEKQSIEARKKMVKKMGLPMVGLGLDYSIINSSEMSASPMNGKDMIMPMLAVTLPVYRRKYNALASEADLRSTAASTSMSATANSLRVDHYNAVQQYRNAERKTGLYRKQYELASRSFDIMLQGFATSAVSLTDVLRARQQLFDYGLKETEAQADLNRSSAMIRRLVASPDIK
jgi:outer membrane protein TolC